MSLSQLELHNRLMPIYGVNLDWSGRSGQSDILERRLLALARLRAQPGQTPTKSAAPVSKNPRSRPRKLTWHDERMIAVFIAHRELARRPVKNAVTDAMQKFGISRAKVFRIRQNHGSAARIFAVLLMKLNKKKFRWSRIQFTDFSDWGPDRH